MDKILKITLIKNGLKSNYVINVVPKNDSLVLGTWGGGVHIFYKDTITQVIKEDTALINELDITNNSTIYAKDIAEGTILYDLKNKKNCSVTLGTRTKTHNNTTYIYSDYKLFKSFKRFKGISLYNTKLYQCRYSLFLF